MAAELFDYAELLRPDLPPAAAKWTGFPKYNFVGGHTDADSVPVEGLIAAAATVLKREGSSLSTYGLQSGPLGYRPLREFIVRKLARRDPDYFGLVARSRSRQSGAAVTGRHGHRRANDLWRCDHAVDAPGREYRRRLPSITTA
jgi:hypothetical protein